MRAATVATILGIVGTITYLMFKAKKVKPVSVIIDLKKPLMQEPLMQEPLMQEPLIQEPLIQEPLMQEPIENLIDDKYIALYDMPGFGIDIHRNTDNHELDDYLNLPLVGTGITYSNSSMADADIHLVPLPNPSARYKYIRLVVKETREESPVVNIGSIQFYSGSEQIKQSDIHIWNPHTGEKSIYTGPWSDSDMRTIIFCFPTMLKITKYLIKTASTPPANDPSLWTLEGSKNGTYWVPIHTVDEDLPILRGKSMYFIIAT